MAKFSNDKEICDGDFTAEDGSGDLNELLPPKTFFNYVLIEALCGIVENNEEKRQKLYEGVCRCLTNSKTLDGKINLDNLMDARRSMASNLLEIVYKIHRSIVVTPTLDVKYLDYMKTFECAKYQDKYNQSFDELEVIGEGGFGKVYKAKHKFDEIIYAVKKVFFKLKNDSEYIKVIREVKNIANLNHLNVVGYKNAWIESKSSQSEISSESSSSSEGRKSSSSEKKNNNQNPAVDAKPFYSGSSNGYTSQNGGLEEMSEDSLQGNFSESSQMDSGCEDFLPPFTDLPLKWPKAMLCIQMEFCDCDLRLWLDKRAEGDALPFQMNELDIFKDILNGVQYIHLQSTIHRDLKPQNIFYSTNGNVMKIGDFGLSTLETSFPIKHKEQANRHSSNLGTPPYAAPEQRQGNNYNNKVDIYSLGVILIEILVKIKTRMQLFEIIENISKGDIPQEILEKGSDYVCLIKDLLEADPKKRKSAKEILSLSLICGQDIHENLKKQLLEKDRLLEEKDRIIADMLASLGQDSSLN